MSGNERLFEVASRNAKLQPIFGPEWSKQNLQFLASDDRVRGGSSQSTLDIQRDSDGDYALFHGVLDTKTLGGAGFASQKTAHTTRHWDFSDTTGIVLDILKADGKRTIQLHVDEGKRYTLTISNEIADKRPDGRDASTLLYEYSFDTSNGRHGRYVEWNEFQPMYRGKPQKDAAPLNPADIRRWSFMIRSFFDQQHGEFSLSIRSVSAYQQEEKIAVSGESSVGVEKASDVKNESWGWCAIQ